MLLLEIEKKGKKKPNIQPESLVQSEQTEPEHDMGNVYKQEMLRGN